MRARQDGESARAPERPRSRPGRASRRRAARRRAALARAAATTSSPRPTWATTSRSSSRSSREASAPRTSAWSSATSSRITRSPRARTRRRHAVPDRSRGACGSGALREAAQAVARACPGVEPAPSSRISTPSRASSIQQFEAPAWRMTLVTPSRTTQPNSGAELGAHDAGVVGQVGATPAAASAIRAEASSACEVDVAVAGDGGAQVGERVAGEASRCRRSRSCLRAVAVDELARRARTSRRRPSASARGSRAGRGRTGRAPR